MAVGEQQFGGGGRAEKICPNVQFFFLYFSHSVVSKKRSSPTFTSDFQKCQYSIA